MSEFLPLTDVTESTEAERATSALLTLMARLRDPLTGCPWDREQTFATVAPYTLEEAYEVADAIDSGDPTQLRDELGDLLFQVVFHSRMAEEREWFDFAAVAQAIHDKLVRRHPHVFGNTSLEGSEAVTRTWEELKARERTESAKAEEAPDLSALANVPKALPALTRAAKLGRRAARVGFDWPDPGQVRDKVMEELREVDEALASGDMDHATEEVGDLLFAIANWTVHLKIDPEEALRAANGKFERRFREMESIAREGGTELQALSPVEWESLWQEAKRRE
jgi:MazG family protein